MNNLYLILSVILAFTCVGLLLLYLRIASKYKQFYNKFKSIIDIEEESLKLLRVQKIEIAEHKKAVDELEKQEVQLKQDYQRKKEVYDRLLSDISVLEENLEFLSYGVYKPHFDFDTSDKYKDKLNSVNELQKTLIREKKAAVCPIEWEVSGSKAEGRKMINRIIKLVLRAFNGECDSAILKVKWNNAVKMEERINKAFESLNQLGETNRVYITGEYLQSKLDELHLVHEYQEKLYDEREEQKRIQEEMREEEKVRRELEKAQREAEQEEDRFEKALVRARKEVETAQGEELDRLKIQLVELEQRLKEAQEAKERAKSQAELTKAGHIYVISNIGSFGEDIYKIGMTRRLEPFDRIRELGDASVPFCFDVHAMIYSTDAPSLEYKLQRNFDSRRLNLVNARKEFFNLSLTEIEHFVKENHGEIEFTKVAEAKEYRETVSIREQKSKEEQMHTEVNEKFPSSL